MWRESSSNLTGERCCVKGKGDRSIPKEITYVY
jgi:hypothetical protein